MAFSEFDSIGYCFVGTDLFCEFIEGNDKN